MSGWACYGIVKKSEFPCRDSRLHASLGVFGEETERKGMRRREEKRGVSVLAVMGAVRRDVVVG